MVGLADGGKILRIHVTDMIPACDGRTDGQTSCDGIVRAMHMRCAVKMNVIYVTLCQWWLEALTSRLSRGSTFCMVPWPCQFWLAVVTLLLHV